MTIYDGGVIPLGIKVPILYQINLVFYEISFLKIKSLFFHQYSKKIDFALAWLCSGHWGAIKMFLAPNLGFR